MKTIGTMMCAVWLLLLTLPVQAVETLNLSSIKGSTLAVVSGKVVKEAFAHLGVEIIVTEYPAKRGLLYANEGKVDGELHRVAGTEIMYPNLIMVPVSINIFEAVVYSKEVNFQVRGWESLKPYKTGVRRGVIYSDRGTEGMDRIFKNSYEELFQALDRKEVDLIVIPRLSGLKMSARPRLHHIRALEPAVVSKPLYLYLHKKNKHLVPRLTIVLQEMEKKGRINEIRVQFMKDLSH